MGGLAKRLTVAVLATLATALVAELAFRATRERFGVRTTDIWELRAHVCDGRSRFRPAAYVGWTFEPGREGVDASGFLGPGFPRARRPGVARIACLGGSTTAGNLYEGYAASYPGALAAVLSERLGHEVEVLNFGVAGWTTAESLVNWMLNARDFAPDVVVVHHAINDVFPRLAEGFRSDYRHYTHPWREEPTSFLHRFLTRWSDIYAAVQLHEGPFQLSEHVSIPIERLGRTTLDPATHVAFARNLGLLVEDVRRAGGVPVLMSMPWERARPSDAFDGLCIDGMREHYELARSLAAATDTPFFDLAAVDDPRLAREFVDRVHFSSAGNRRKAELLADFLLARGLVR